MRDGAHIGEHVLNAVIEFSHQELLAPRGVSMETASRIPVAPIGILFRQAPEKRALVR